MIDVEHLGARVAGTKQSVKNNLEAKMDVWLMDEKIDQTGLSRLKGILAEVIANIQPAALVLNLEISKYSDTMQIVITAKEIELS